MRKISLNANDSHLLKGLGGTADYY